MRVLATTAIAALLTGIGVSADSLGADKARATRHLTADQAIACVKQAVAAKAGSITKMEVKVDDGRTVCEVHLEDANNKNFQVQVDAAANKLIRVKD